MTINTRRAERGQLGDPRKRGTRPGVRPVPVLDQARRAARDASARRRMPRARRAAPPARCSPCRCRGSAYPSPRTRQQMQEERQERLERRRPRRECARRRHPALAERRSEVESGAQNLHEDAVRHAIAVRPAPRLQHTHVRVAARGALRSSYSSRLFPAPGFADDRDDASDAAAARRSRALRSSRQFRLTADVRRQSRSARRLQPRGDPRLSENPERRYRTGLRHRAPPDAHAAVCM